VFAVQSGGYRPTAQALSATFRLHLCAVVHHVVKMYGKLD